MMHTTRDGLITVPAPPGPEWAVEEQVGVQQGQAVITLVKCRRVADGEYFFLLAKDYTVPPEHVIPAEVLVREVYANNYRKHFADVEYEVPSTTVSGGIEWHEAGLRLRHSQYGPIVKLERVCTVGNHVLVLSAEGTPLMVDAHWAAATAWLDGTTFATAEASRPASHP